MKKLVMTVAVLACAASVVAQTVTSANVVGYNKITKVGSGFQLIGIAFGNGSNKLSELVDTDQFTGNFIIDQADQIITWTGSNYVTYALYDDTVTRQWRLASDFFGAEADPVLPVGSAAFVKAPAVADVDLIVSGEVVADQYATNSISTGLQMVSFPFACDITLNVNEGTDLADSGATGNFIIDSADQIITWDDSLLPNPGYVTYALYDDTVTREWRAANSFFTPGQTPTLDLGKGFWYKAQGGFTWVQENPYYGNL